MSRLIITIGRQYGSGGKEIGKKLAKRLAIPFYGKEELMKLYPLRKKTLTKPKPIAKLYSLEPKDCYTIGEITEKFLVNERFSTGFLPIFLPKSLLFSILLSFLVLAQKIFIPRVKLT